MDGRKERITGPIIEQQKTALGMEQRIAGLKSIHRPDGSGPAVLRKIRLDIEGALATPEERTALELAFDTKIGELVLNEMNQFEGKRDRMKYGFNAADRESHQTLLQLFLKYDIPQLPMFSEERRASLLNQAQQVMWSKGYIPGEEPPSK